MLLYDQETIHLYRLDVVQEAGLEEVSATMAGPDLVIRSLILSHKLSTYRHNLLVLRAAMLVRRFPLAQRCRLRDISVRMNFGRL